MSYLLLIIALYGTCKALQVYLDVMRALECIGGLELDLGEM